MRTLIALMLCSLAAVACYTAQHMNKSVLDVTPRDMQHTAKQHTPIVVWR